MAMPVTHPLTGKPLTYRQLNNEPEFKERWNKSGANELGRLTQGVGTRIKGTDTIFFIKHSQVPKHKTVTYGRFVCDIRPQKAEKERTRLTVGGNLINYGGGVSTQTADLTTSKCLWNSVVSTQDAEHMCLDLKNFYLGTPMEEYEYMRLHIKDIPDKIIQQYNLHELTHNDWVYIEARGGVYGLPQAGKLANYILKERLAKHGYAPTPTTPGLWQHKIRPITFTLIVDDFGVKYVGKQHAEHLKNALEETYTVSTDWTGGLYCGITLTWDYRKRTVKLSMPGYIEQALHKFQHPEPTQPQHSPYPYKEPTYGVKIQLTAPPDNSPSPEKKEITRIQQVLGTLLYWARAVKNSIIPAISSLASEQAKATEATTNKLTQLLNFCATHTDATIQYTTSDMVLHIHSDASYLSEPNARSRLGGIFFLS
jgi:hypothetical protein